MSCGQGGSPRRHSYPQLTKMTFKIKTHFLMAALLSVTSINIFPSTPNRPTCECDRRKRHTPYTTSLTQIWTQGSQRPKLMRVVDSVKIQQYSQRETALTVYSGFFTSPVRKITGTRLFLWLRTSLIDIWRILVIGVSQWSKLYVYSLSPCSLPPS